MSCCMEDGASNFNPQQVESGGQKKECRSIGINAAAATADRRLRQRTEEMHDVSFVTPRIWEEDASRHIASPSSSSANQGKSHLCGRIEKYNIIAETSLAKAVLPMPMTPIFPRLD